MHRSPNWYTSKDHMVRETRTTFGLEDISGVRVTCSKCAGDIGYLLNQQSTRFQAAKNCPHCGESWNFLAHDGNDQYLPEFDLLFKMKSLLNKPSSEIKLRFEMSEPE